ncbi:MAG: c-type cytochrome biogenesis protein CcmI [Alphaproteobacteria bacterium]|nr:c-type cytochrome biogenesis protein CcmI [Alphaproteobacteria bacterium]
MLWVVLTIFLGIAAAFAAAPLLRKAAAVPHTNSRAQLYQRQINEIDKEETHGVISTPEAEALRVEAQRRLLAASSIKTTKEAQMPLSRTSTALAIAGMVIAGGVGLYAVKGSPSVPSTNHIARAANIQAPPKATSTTQPLNSVEGMVDGLVARLANNPDDVDGWRMLGWSYFNMDRYGEAADAYQRAVALAPDNVDYQSAYGEAMVRAAGGLVNDEALAVFNTALALNAEDPRARFFKGLALDQAGDASGAISTWIEMVNSAPAGADWVDGLRQRIFEKAREAGVDIGGRIAAAPDTATTASRGPTTAQVMAAMERPANDRQAMIEGMVANLAARLKENPGDSDGWIKLIRSKTVLGRQGEAVEDLKSALNAFEDAPETRARIIAEAQALGVRAQ